MSEASGAQPDRSLAPRPELIAAIRRLQRDGLVLVTHLAESQHRRLVRATPGRSTPTDQDAGKSALAADLALLTWPPELIAAFGTSFTGLVETVDRLSRAARPATPLSIQFTAAYLYYRSGRPAKPPGTPNPLEELGASLLQPTRTELDRARGVRFKLHVLRGLMLVAMLLAVWLLMHVDRGRRIQAERATVQAELTRSYAELARLEKGNAFRVRQVPPPPDPAPPTLQPTSNPGVAKASLAPAATAQPPARATDRLPADELGEFCWGPDPIKVLTPKQGLEPGKGGRDGEPLAAIEANGTPKWYLEPKTILAQDLCSGLVQQKKREGLSWTRIAAWNCTQSLMNPLNLVPALWQWGAAMRDHPYPAADFPCAISPATLTAPADGTDWARTELRMQDGIVSLTGYILPVLLGGIGSAVFVVRRIERRLREATLSAHDGTAALGRVLLGATCGGLLGLLFGTSGPVEIGGFSLALGAWALLIGYGLETVLRLLDRLIEVTVRTLGGQDKDRKVPVVPPGS